MELREEARALDPLAADLAVPGRAPVPRLALPGRAPVRRAADESRDPARREPAERFEGRRGPQGRGSGSRAARFPRELAPAALLRFRGPHDAGRAGRAPEAR